jgi:hypothetical protein
MHTPILKNYICFFMAGALPFLPKQQDIRPTLALNVVQLDADVPPNTDAYVYLQRYELEYEAPDGSQYLLVTDYLDVEQRKVFIYGKRVTLDELKARQDPKFDDLIEALEERPMSFAIEMPNDEVTIVAHDEEDLYHVLEPRVNLMVPQTELILPN